jgi:hypothetical protein
MVPSADGSAFYGVQAKYQGGGYVYSVWWQKPGQIAQRVDSGTSGQGQLRGAGGPLWCVRYAAPGDGQPIQTIEITQFVPWPVQKGEKGDKGDVGPQGPAGDPGTGGGALDPSDRKALDWIKHWISTLLG